MKLLIKNGTVINPGDRKITKADVLVTDGVISKVAPGLKVDLRPSWQCRTQNRWQINRM